MAVKSKSTEETVVEKGGQKMPVTRDLAKLQQISINSGRKKIIAENPEGENEEVVKGPVTSFSHADFMTAWNKMSQNVKAQGKDSLYLTLTKREPVVTPDFKITLLIDNKTQEQSLERDKQDLLEFLRTELNNFAIVLEAKIEESSNDTFLYTNKDKFKKLAEKNPHLLLLQKRLNLDIDF